VRAALGPEDTVINCAAWTDVDGAEADPAAAAAVNATGAGNVAAAAGRVVHVSTDYVFDGTAREPYVESAPTAPLQEYGRTKLAGELALAAANPDHLIVRSSWLFGAGGPNFVETMLRLGDERDELRVVDDQVGCPTFTGHLAGALAELARGDLRGVLHVAGGGSCSWFGFASAIFRRSGADIRLEPCTTAEFPRPARRPAFSVLASERGAPRLPAWEEGLDAYLGVRA
jgi:dTDP-4-dehydrorhamnose reductase